LPFTITVAAVLVGATKEDGVSQVGPVEVLLSTALTGCTFAIFGGQPLCIVGVTGPVTIFTTSCFTLAQAAQIPFLPFFCCVQLWSAAMHMLLTATNACRAISLVSRFSCETFGMLSKSSRELTQMLRPSHREHA
jgi:boron transporter